MAIRAKIFDGSGSLGDIPPIKLTDGKLSDQTAGFLSGAIRGIIQALNGQLSFGSGESGHAAGNFDAQWIDLLTPSGANTEFTVPHGLGRKPIGYSVYRSDIVGGNDIYDSRSGSWSNTQLYLKCGVASATLRILLF